MTRWTRFAGVAVGIMMWAGCAAEEEEPPALDGATQDGVAAQAAMEEIRIELRNLAELQEVFFADNMAYAPSLEDLLAAPPVDHPDVAIRLISGGSAGWAAEATHRLLPSSRGCALVHGDPPEYEMTLEVPISKSTVTCTVM